MDAKALAKSKRAHSLHHSKKHHPNPTSKATTGLVTASGGGKKPTNKQDRDKPHQAQVPKVLPSNWDRYEEEFDSGSEDLSQVSTSHASDVVRPKSKGADYAYLISEAKAQSQAYSSSESFSLIDDTLDGFNEGLGSLLSIKGQRMLSWISDDNFPLDDQGTSSHEASFLSLNLHSLAEQLSKATLAERLFIEPDLLPPECTDLQSRNEKSPDEAQSRDNNEATENVIDGLASSSTSEEKKNIHLSHEYMSSNSSWSIHTSSPTSITHPVDDLWQVNEASGSTSGKSTSDVSADSVAKKPSRFEAAAAEAELDILLGSFNETKFFDSTSMTQQSSRTSNEAQASSIQSLLVPIQNVREGSDVTFFGRMDTSLDDTLDDLLKETSSAINTKGASPVHKVNAASHGAPSATQPPSKSKILDDFDSWLDTI
ncbi:hypothetical protein ACH5RR_028693 [Cinchona calisaya]|uniref:Uncharacterized protein n=1 Tax=Cinchona calisaya TaxID=153742 RepID=A0ABD2YPJ0_9GENT